MSFDADAGLPQEAVDEHVTEEIEDNEVVLFMKGSPMAPQCGYSDKALKLLRQHREGFATVDVLTSLDEFREALAEYSGWETIPQTYVDGEFVGGSDVLEQLDEDGDLAETLNASNDAC